MSYRVWIGLMALAACTVTATQTDARSHHVYSLQNATDVVWNNANGASATDARPSGNATVDAAVAEPLPPQMEQQIEQRLRENLSPELLQNFGLFIYVSKAEIGPWKQRMLVFQKVGDDLLPLFDWPVSTGRETVEADAQGVQLGTNTPAGYFELDPKRLFENYRSIQWNEPMPYAMFFNWMDHGTLTGLAIHAATDAAIGQLGTRASAGCVRLSPDNARTLFNLVRDNYKGMAPKFAFDKYTSTVMNNGLVLHDPTGNVVMTSGYSVLVYIDDYGGQSLEAKAY
jgi:lipoprotein-anchoring transpeptidase ErfK/SrfK